MLLACHTGSAMRVPVPNTQLNIERSSEHDRASSFNSVVRCIYIAWFASGFTLCGPTYGGPWNPPFCTALTILALESAAAPKIQRDLKQTRQERQPESGVIPTKVGMQCFSLDSNWILVWTLRRLFWMRLFHECPSLLSEFQFLIRHIQVAFLPPTVHLRDVMGTTIS